jgi:hypothetical protein
VKGIGAKMVSVPVRREQVAYAVRRGLPQRRSCTPSPAAGRGRRRRAAPASLVVRPRLRPVRQRPAAQVPDPHRRAVLQSSS